MTDQRLRDLLEERVADLTTTDLAAPAWAAGRVVRRRRRGYAAGVLAAAVVLAVLVVPRVLTTTAGDEPPVAVRPGPAGETYAGYPVTSAPSAAEEAALPTVASRLPEHVDVRDAVSSGVPGPASIAIGTVRDDALVDVRLLEDDGWHLVDVSGLAPVDGVAPVVDDMLSPDGRWVIFPRPGGVALYDVVAQRFTEESVPDTYLPLTAQWVSADTWSVDLNGSDGSARMLGSVPGSSSSSTGTVLSDLVPPDGATTYGPVAANGEVAFPPSVSRGDVRAQAVLGLETASSEVAASPKILVSPDNADRSRWLVFDGDAGPAAMPRMVIGWLDADTVVYLSPGAVPRLIAWDVGTEDFHLVTEVRGLGGAQSRAGFADLSTS